MRRVDCHPQPFCLLNPFRAYLPIQNRTPPKESVVHDQKIHLLLPRSFESIPYPHLPPTRFFLRSGYVTPAGHSSPLDNPETFLSARSDRTLWRVRVGASLFHLQNPIPRLDRVSIPHPGFIPTPSAKRNPSPTLSPSPPDPSPCHIPSPNPTSTPKTYHSLKTYRCYNCNTYKFHTRTTDV